MPTSDLIRKLRETAQEASRYAPRVVAIPLSDFALSLQTSSGHVNAQPSYDTVLNACLRYCVIILSCLIGTLCNKQVRHKPKDQPLTKYVQALNKLHKMAKSSKLPTQIVKLADDLRSNAAATWNDRNRRAHMLADQNLAAAFVRLLNAAEPLLQSKLVHIINKEPLERRGSKPCNYRISLHRYTGTGQPELEEWTVYAQNKHVPQPGSVCLIVPAADAQSDDVWLDVWPYLVIGKADLHTGCDTQGAVHDEVSHPTLHMICPNSDHKQNPGKTPLQWHDGKRYVSSLSTIPEIPQNWNPSQSGIATPHDRTPIRPKQLLLGNLTETTQNELKSKGWQILELIRSSPRCTILKARHNMRNNIFALKILNNRLSLTDKEHNRLSRIADLTHEKISGIAVKHHPDLSTQTSPIVLAMDFVEGITLRKWLENTPSLDRREKMARTICTAVAKLHSLGVAHRDLHPGNILVTHEKPILIDFEFARDDTDRLRTSSHSFAMHPVGMGCEPYAPPEQVRGIMRPQDEMRADVHALGWILFELLAGIRDGIPIDPPEQYLSEKIATIHALPTESLIGFLSACTSKQSSERFIDADEARKQLDRILSCRPSAQGDVYVTPWRLSSTISRMGDQSVCWLYNHQGQIAVGIDVRDHRLNTFTLSAWRDAIPPPGLARPLVWQPDRTEEVRRFVVSPPAQASKPIGAYSQGLEPRALARAIASVLRLWRWWVPVAGQFKLSARDVFLSETGYLWVSRVRRRDEPSEESIAKAVTMLALKQCRHSIIQAGEPKQYRWYIGQADLPRWSTTQIPESIVTREERELTQLIWRAIAELSELEQGRVPPNEFETWSELEAALIPAPETTWPRLSGRREAEAARDAQLEELRLNFEDGRRETRTNYDHNERIRREAHLHDLEIDRERHEAEQKLRSPEERESFLVRPFEAETFEQWMRREAEHLSTFQQYVFWSQATWNGAGWQGGWSTDGEEYVHVPPYTLELRSSAWGREKIDFVPVVAAPLTLSNRLMELRNCINQLTTEASSPSEVLDPSLVQLNASLFSSLRSLTWRLVCATCSREAQDWHMFVSYWSEHMYSESGLWSDGMPKWLEAHHYHELANVVKMCGPEYVSGIPNLDAMREWASSLERALEPATEAIVTRNREEEDFDDPEVDNSTIQNETLLSAVCSERPPFFNGDGWCHGPVPFDESHEYGLFGALPQISVQIMKAVDTGPRERTKT